MSKNEKSSAATAVPSPQTAFVEECVREGWRILDVQMWQNLCKKLATLSDDSDLSVMLLLGIADEHGISPIQLCAYARDEGYKVLDSEAVEHLAQMYIVGDEARDDDEEETHAQTQGTDRVDEDDDNESSNGKRPKRNVAFPDDGDEF